jgi:hypothetical protein
MPPLATGRAHLRSPYRIASRVAAFSCCGLQRQHRAGGLLTYRRRSLRGICDSQIGRIYQHILSFWENL